VGTGARAGARDAALLNGAAAHALDFDDGHAWMGAHPSAPIVSAAAALAEAVDARGDKLLAAVVAGVHAGTMLSLALGHGHYVVGWHPTGTVGAVAAAAACAAILDLGVAETAVALNHAAAQAAGARIVFGSMAKPLNAGNAAANAVQATLLAQAGVTVTSDVVDGAQGVAAIYGGDWDPGRFDAITGGASAMAAFGSRSMPAAAPPIRRSTPFSICARAVTSSRTRSWESRSPSATRCAACAVTTDRRTGCRPSSA
jgi:2-methylcitrate dehydratase PrpD